MEECGMSEASRVYPLVAVAFVPSIRRSGGRACPLSPVAHEYLRDHQSARRRVHGGARQTRGRLVAREVSSTAGCCCSRDRSVGLAMSSDECRLSHLSKLALSLIHI